MLNITKTNPNCVLLSFDFFDRNDGAILDILHTSSELTPKISGVVRGLPDGVLDWGAPPTKVPPLTASRFRRFPWQGISMGFASVFSICVGAAMLWLPSRSDLPGGVIGAPLLLSGLFLGVVSFAVWQREERRRYPTALWGGELISD
jgi:hypothetical protein